jgi:EmrB/QacA subfamily drug resistance transporter
MGSIPRRIPNTPELEPRRFAGGGRIAYVARMPSHALIPLIVACALFMEHLDSNVISTSLPVIAADLRQDPIALKLALTSYLLSLAVFIPISGWMADRFGARVIFRAAIAVFTIGSILCGLSTGLFSFVMARIVQGAGGAMMVPVGRLIILRSTPKSELVSAIAWLTIPAMIGPLTGPLLGGFISTYFNWRWIFFINIPISVIGMALASRFIDNTREDRTPPLDVPGALLSGVGLSGLVFGLAIMGQNLLPVAASVTITAVGAIATAFYVSHALRTPHPVIDLRLLAIPTFRAGVVGASLFRIGVGALPFLMPLLLQLGFGLSAFASGLITFASAAGALVMKFTAAPIIRRFGFRWVLVVNALISSAFMLANVLFTAETPHLVIALVLLTGGFFRSLEFTAIHVIAYADIEPQAMSRATSFASVAQQLSLSLGVAIGALALEAARAMKDQPVLAAGDFGAAFIVVAAIAATSAALFAALPHDAGAELSGAKERADARLETEASGPA